MTPLKNPISSLLVVLLNVAWCIAALVMVLTIGLAGVSAFHDIRNLEIDIPVRGSLKFSPRPGASRVSDASRARH